MLVRSNVGSARSAANSERISISRLLRTRMSALLSRMRRGRRFFSDFFLDDTTRTSDKCGITNLSGRQIHVFAAIRGTMARWVGVYCLTINYYRIHEILNLPEFDHLLPHDHQPMR